MEHPRVICRADHADWRADKVDMTEHLRGTSAFDFIARTRGADSESRAQARYP